MTRYAVCVTDLLAVSMAPEAVHPLRYLFAPLLSGETVTVEPGTIAGDAFLLREDTPADRWQAIVAIVRTRVPLRGGAFRLYEKSKRGWRRV